MYSLYEIPDFIQKDGSIGKVGCTVLNPTERVSQQGYTNFNVLETHTDPILAGDRELELQKEYGYRVDTSHYMISVQNRPKWSDKTRHKLNKEDCIKGGQWHKDKSKPKDWVKKYAFKAASLASMKRIVCEHCGKDANTGNYSRWHGDNCKHKKAR